MLAPSQLPQEYEEWNSRYGAPFGFRNAPGLRNALYRKSGLSNLVYRWDPFAYQANNTTRCFEYPWVYFSLPEKKEMKLLEIGGGLSGLQFLLDCDGHNVVNIDPGQENLRKGWQYADSKFSTLNRQLGTNVHRISTTIGKADLEADEFDGAYSVSVLEHLSEEAVSEVMVGVWRCLKPGGMFLLTTDLFLDVEPFTDLKQNKYGRNFNMKWLVERAPFQFTSGNRQELYGFEEFDYLTVLRNLETYMIGKNYPALTQCVILQKPV